MLLKLRLLAYRIFGGDVRIEHFDRPEPVLVRGEVVVNVQGPGVIVLEDAREQDEKELLRA